MGLSLLLPCPALATGTLTPINPPPLEFSGIYEFNLAALRLGKMGIQIEQTPDHYAMTSDIMSTGLVNTLVKHSSHTTVDASGGKDFNYPNRDYETTYQTRKKKKYVHMVYKNGQLAEEKLVPADNRTTRPAVPDEQKKDAVDPLSFILFIRQGLFDAMQKKKSSFTLDAYDGRRLTRAFFTVGEQKNLRYNDRKIPVITVDVTRKLIAGFTASELADHDPNEPVLHIYFSNDAKLIPVRVEFAFWMGTVSATLAKECHTGESCLLGIKE